MTDASNWLPLTSYERRRLALKCIEEMYQDKWDGNAKIDVYDLLIETSDAVWSASTATGDAMFLPGQFSARFQAARQPEGNIYFAGEHLSYHHTWISGAANSALQVVRDMLNDQQLPALAKSTSSKKTAAPGKDTRERAATLPYLEDEEEEGLVRQDIRQIITPLPAKVPFKFEPNEPKFREGPSKHFRDWIPGEDADSEYDFPTHLGMAGPTLGAVTTNLKAPGAIGM